MYGNQFSIKIKRNFPIITRRDAEDAETQGRGIKMKENEISAIIVDTAVYLHKKLGSGLLENVYEVILAKLLAQKGLHVQRQVSIPIDFEGEHFDEGFRDFC